MLKLEPLFNRVIVEREIVEERTEGGIYIPEQAKEKPMRGKVVAVGPGKPLPSGELQKVPVSPGDEILFGKYAGSSVTVEGKDLLLLLDDDIFAIIRP